MTMNSLKGLIIALTVISMACANPAPPSPAFTLAADFVYENTLNPPTGNYPASRPRAGVYWGFQDKEGEAFKPLQDTGRTSITQAPNLIKYNSDSVIFETEGPNDLGLYGGAAAAGVDKAVRLTGEDNSCLKSDPFGGPEDVCLKNPSKCLLYDASGVNGISMSVWVNLPQTFNIEERYIVDTGGDEYGTPGIKIGFRGSSDGRRYSHQLSVLVSVGDKYWKVVLNGMMRPFWYNNIGFRWSAANDGTSTPYGLQVFVNGTSAAWKRSAYPAQTPAPPEYTAADVHLSMGCKLDGTHAVQGRFDNLAVWYWRLKDGDANQKPTTTLLRQEINYMEGGLTFMPSDPANRDLTNRFVGTSPTGEQPWIAPDSWDPWQYIWEKNNNQEDQSDQTYVDDNTPATDGDCDPTLPNTWGKGGINGEPHPIDCADTGRELRNAMSYDENYWAEELVKAMVKTVNKNDRLSDDDVEYMMSTCMPMLESKFADTKKELSVSGNGRTLANLVFVVSRLTNYEKYGEYWQKRHDQARGLGATRWMYKLNEWLMRIGADIPEQSAVLVEANQTVSLTMHAKRSQINSGVYFPSYLSKVTTSSGQTESLYRFQEQRTNTWGRVRDYIRLSVHVFQFFDLTQKLVINSMMFNQLGESLPAFIDTRVSGVENTKFFVNSRVLSLTMTPPLNGTTLDTYPVKYFVEHQKAQPEHPAKKGAILCAHWKFNEVNSSHVGAWDTLACKLIETNDTHSTCECSHMSDYAILMEDHKPPGEVGDGGYMFCYILYGVSLICLLIFMTLVVAKERLHYELHIISFNVACAMFLAIIFYLFSLIFYEKRVPCITVSIFIHYCYTAAYVWCMILAHYIFRAITSGKLGGKIIMYYCLGGWGFPAVLVCILAAIDVTRYGIGTRCLGSQYDYFLWIYIGTFLLFCLLVCPLFVISLLNLGNNPVKDEEDREDIKFALIGLIAYWPIIMLVWLMAMFVYLIPMDTMICDFLFEMFNSLQGIFIFLLLGMLVPSVRNALLCCKKQQPRDARPHDDVLYSVVDENGNPEEQHEPPVPVLSDGSLAAPTSTAPPPAPPPEEPPKKNKKKKEPEKKEAPPPEEPPKKEKKKKEPENEAEDGEDKEKKKKKKKKAKKVDIQAMIAQIQSAQANPPPAV